MFYISLLLAAIAIVIFKLGALSVWVTLLSMALAVMAVVAVAAAIYAMLMRYRSIRFRKP